MIKPSPIAITAIVCLSLWVGFCRAQGNTNTSSGSCGSNGECGPFGSCNTLDVPPCSCLHGFNQRNPSDWESGNWSSGCERKVALSCGNDTTTDRFWRLESMKLSGYTSRSPVAKEQCEGVCLGNCSCIAYAFDNGIGCMFWSVPLIDVQKVSTLGSDLYLRLSVSEFGNFYSESQNY